MVIIMVLDFLCARHDKKGYILTLSTVTLFAIVVYFVLESNALSSKHNSFVIGSLGTSRVSYFVDDVTDDLRPMLSYDRNRTWLTFSENLTYNKTVFFSGYAAFLSNNYASISGMNTTIGYGDSLEIRFTDGLVYSSNFSNQRIDFFNASGNTTGINRYEFYIVSRNHTDGYVDPVWTAGGVYLYVNYTDPDPSASFVREGYVDPAVQNTLKIDFGSGQIVYISVGAIDGRQNVVSLNQTNIYVLTSVALSANRTSDYPIAAAYNTPLNVTFQNSNFSAGVPA